MWIVETSMLIRAKATQREIQQRADHFKEDAPKRKEKKNGWGQDGRGNQNRLLYFFLQTWISFLFFFFFFFFFCFSLSLQFGWIVESSLLAFLLFSLFVSKDEKPAESLCLSSQFIRSLFVCFVLFCFIFSAK